jgi:hypothetical protein
MNLLERPARNKQSDDEVIDATYSHPRRKVHSVPTETVSSINQSLLSSSQTSRLLENPDCRLFKEISEVRRAYKMECWSNGILEYWVLNPSLQHSVTPLIQSQ